MFYASMVMFAAAFTSVVLRLRRRLFSARWFHQLVLWMTPIGVVAIIGGWVLAETGRQPFVVYGQLRTSEAASDIAPASVIFSLVCFVVIYLSLLTAYVVYVIRAVRRGPEADDPERLEPIAAPDDAGVPV